MQEPIQMSKKAPSLLKESLLMALGFILSFVGVGLSFVSLLWGDLVFVGGAVLSIVYLSKHYKKKAFDDQHVVSRFAIVKQTVTLAVFLSILFVIILLVNIFRL